MGFASHTGSVDGAQEREPADGYLLLKWGSIKGWDGLSEKSRELLQRWSDMGVSLSAMAQKDTPEQKEVLCELIRQFEGEISNDWDGETYSKERAIDYIKNYGA